MPIDPLRRIVLEPYLFGKPITGAVRQIRAPQRPWPPLNRPPLASSAQQTQPPVSPTHQSPPPATPGQPNPPPTTPVHTNPPPATPVNQTPSPLIIDFSPRHYTPISSITNQLSPPIVPNAQVPHLTRLRIWIINEREQSLSDGEQLYQDQRPAVTELSTLIIPHIPSTFLHLPNQTINFANGFAITVSQTIPNFCGKFDSTWRCVETFCVEVTQMEPGYVLWLVIHLLHLPTTHHTFSHSLVSLSTRIQKSKYMHFSFVSLDSLVTESSV